MKNDKPLSYYFYLRKVWKYRPRTAAICTFMRFGSREAYTRHANNAAKFLR